MNPHDAPVRRFAHPGRLPAAVLALATLTACRSADHATTPPPADTLVSVGSTELFVRQEGVGEPLVVVHGGPVLDHGYLARPLRPLADGFRLVLFDQRLSGRSPGRVDSASVRLDTVVADIERLRAELGLGRIHLLGHSWGGLLAMKYAVAHPDRLRSLVLVSPMPPSAELWRREQTALQASLTPEDTAGAGEVRASAGVAAGDPSSIQRLLRLSFRSQLVDPELADSLDFHIGRDYRERSRQFSFLMPDLMSYDLTQQLPALSVPTLVLYGAEEPGATIGGDTLAALLPASRVERVPGAAHFPFLERPVEFHDRVRSFLAGLERGLP